MKKDIQLQCPQCGGNVYWNDDYPHRPFCSERCQLIDLGHWAEEAYKITGHTEKNEHDDESDYLP